MARKRPAASNVVPPALICLDGGSSGDGRPLLTRAEAQALKRSAPITHEQLKQRLKGVSKPPLHEA